MPETTTETKMRADLKDAMEMWLKETDGKRDCVGYIGDGTASFMADAAFSVLMGIADLERYLQKNNGLDTLPIG